MARKGTYCERLNKYTQNYVRENYEQIIFRLTKSAGISKDEIAAAAAAAGESVNAYILDAVKSRMQREAGE